MSKYWKRVTFAAGATLVVGAFMVFYGHPGPVEASMFVPKPTDDGSVWFWRVIHLSVVACLAVLGWMLGGAARARNRRAGFGFSLATSALLCVPLLGVMSLDFGEGTRSWALPMLVSAALMILAIVGAAVSGARVLTKPDASHAHDMAEISAEGRSTRRPEA